jgi:hypothetical protein
MAGRPKGELPAKVKRTGMRQLVVSIGDVQAEQLEELRVKRGERSWAQTIRNMIAYEANKK